MKKTSTLIFGLLCIIAANTFSQNKPINQITLSNSIHYTDTSFTDLPGNGFLIDFGGEVFAVTCKHALWTNRAKEMKTVDFQGQLKEWKMVVLNDPSQYVILGDLINTNKNEPIGERNTDKDYLVFKIKINHSKVIPLKLSLKAVQPSDTVYQIGWTYKTKTSVAKPHTAVAGGYLGSSLIIKSVVRENNAGLSGSPVINKNNELVGIVSSWKFNMQSQQWFEAPCSTDYLWEVLYSYWLKKSNIKKGVSAFQKFLSIYNNANKSEISSYLYTELFYTDWLKNRGLKYGSVEKYSQWTDIMIKKYGVNIQSDNYRNSLLIFDGWKNNYINGKMNIIELEKMLADAKNSIPNYINFGEFAQELSVLGKHQKAIDILLFADEKIQHMGQLYAFLGDAYLAKGDKILAKESYLNCLKTYPEFPQAIDGLEKLK